MSVIFAVFCLSIGLAGYLVDPEISCGGRKPARTPQVKKKKRVVFMTGILKIELLTERVFLPEYKSENDSATMHKQIQVPTPSLQECYHPNILSQKNP